jgi:uncharacterized protein YqeY
MQRNSWRRGRKGTKTYHRAARLTVVPASTPSDLLSELEAIILAKSRLREEQEKLLAESAFARQQWARELAQEAAKGVNVQSVVARCKDLDGKEERNREQVESLARALREVDEAIRHYEQAHRQDLLQALQIRLDQVGEACKEYAELEKWRDVLLGKAETRKPVRSARRSSGGKETGETT